MKTNNAKHKSFHLITASIAVFVTISMIIFPETAFDGALDGLTIWWNVVFPALLPFFIGAEILMGLGVVRFMGTLLQPIMKPLFNVPGVGSFVMAVGLASGFPLGSILTAKIRRQNLCTKTEAERLICFTNTADPLFMFGAVAVGMLKDPYLGTIIAIAHYLSSFTVGILMRFYKKNNDDITYEERKQDNIIVRAFNSMFEAKRSDGRPFGQLMGDAIKNSINTLLLIGGFIILFSVIINIFEIIGFMGIVNSILYKIFSPVGAHPEIIDSFINGFFEVSLGCETAGSLPDYIPLTSKLMAISAIIAWSGISVHAQVASITSDTDINITPFIYARFLHGLLGAIYTIPVSGWLLDESYYPVLADQVITSSAPWDINIWFLSSGWFMIIITILSIITAVTLLLYLIYHGIKFNLFKI